MPLLILECGGLTPLFRLLLVKPAPLDGAPQLRHHRLMDKHCAQCGAAMTCQPEGGCWCAELPPVVPMPTDAKGCLCQNCLLAKIEALQNPAKTKEA